MTNHELLKLIGDVDEEYVLAAGETAKPARPKWRAWAACAACAALILGAYPVYRALQSPRAPVHDYTVAEGNGPMTQTGEIKVPYTGEEMPAPTPEAPPAPNPDSPSTEPDPIPTGDRPIQEDASAQYQNLIEKAGIGYYGGGNYPAWYGGAWIDWETLHVALTGEQRTGELEAQIMEWCGGEEEIIFHSVKYSYGYLCGLLEQISQDSGLADGVMTSLGVDVTENCLGVDIFAETAPEGMLALLAEYDPDGDAIRVQVIRNQTIGPDIVKGPAPEPAPAGIGELPQSKAPQAERLPAPEGE